MGIDALDWIFWGIQGFVIVLAWRQQRHPAAVEALAFKWEHCLIAILLAWIWRLVYCFVLASTGFFYLVPDDVARWMLSWGWSVSPYLISWDGIWQGGTFYVHGAAMSLLKDPLVASKFVSAFYNLLPLIGIFVLAQGLYRSARLSSVAVVAAAPWWIQILLGTGAMTEMPVTGFMLTGAGLLLLALDARTKDAAAGAALMGAAFCFLAGTAFHMVAWMILVSFLLVFAPRLLSTHKQAIRRRLLPFVGISFGYCVVWTLGCWLKFGRPLAFLAAYDANILKYSTSQTLGARLSAYPLAFLYDGWLVLPALVSASIGAWSEGSERRGRERLVIGGVLVALLVQTLSAIVGNPSTGLPVRATVALVAALFPIAVAGIVGAWPNGRSQGGVRTAKVLPVIAVTVLAVAWVVVNHERIFQRVRSQQSLDPDAVAMGMWLHETFAQPDVTGHIRNDAVIHVWLATSPLYPDFSIQYLFGDPRRVVSHRSNDDAGQVLPSVGRDQWLVTDRPVMRDRFEKIATIGKYQIFRATTGTKP